MPFGVWKTAEQREAEEKEERELFRAPDEASRRRLLNKNFDSFP